MIKKVARNDMRKARHARIREKVTGTASVPRLNVFRSNNNIFAQIIDDEKAVTLVSASSIDKELKIEKVTFDRGGYLYHGRVKALAEAARANGLEF